MLKWADQSCSCFFVVILNQKKSIDGINFNTTEIIPGNGTTSEEMEYSFHESYDRKSNYYRLSEVDLNGKREYIGIYHVECSKPEIRISPNPGNTEISIEYKNFEQI